MHPLPVQSWSKVTLLLKCPFKLSKRKKNHFFKFHPKVQNHVFTFTKKSYAQ